MRRWFQEPLLHFLVLGAVLFAAYSVISDRTSDEPREIVVTRGRIEALATSFAVVWQRPPTTAELEGLIRDYIREEVFVREATALGLDRDDTVIRRRLRQKLEFISEDLAAPTEPGEDVLRAWLSAHPEDYRVESRFSFSQFYLDPQRRGGNLAGDAATLLARLRAAGNSDPGLQGDSLMLERNFEGVPASEVQEQFGEKFAASLSALEPGQWQGPIESGYGVHLVRVHQRVEGRVPALEEVRDQVRRDWSHAERLKVNEKFYQGLLERYTVTIEPSQQDESAKDHVMDARR
jgi:hypothetical protein